MGAEVAERVPVPDIIVKEITSPSAMGLPWTSLTSARMSLVLVPLAGRVLGVAVTVMLAITAPLKVTVTDCVTLFAVAVTVADPAVVPEIRETETTPVASGVIAVMVSMPLLKVPRVVVNVTNVPSGLAPPEVSVSVAVSTLELEPSAGMLVGLAVRVIVPTGTGLEKITVVVVVIKPYVAVMVAVSVTVGAVSVVAAIPLSVVPLSGLSDPLVVVNFMVSPSIATPESFLSCSVIREVSVPLAKMAAGVACISERLTPMKVTAEEAESVPTVAVTVETTEVADAIAVSVAEAIPSTVTVVGVILPLLAEKFTTVPSGTLLPPEVHTRAVTVISFFPFAYKYMLGIPISIRAGVPSVWVSVVSSLNACSELLNSPVSALILKLPGSQSAV